jgi:hypothetical protein
MIFDIKLCRLWIVYNFYLIFKWFIFEDFVDIILKDCLMTNIKFVIFFDLL